MPPARIRGRRRRAALFLLTGAFLLRGTFLNFALPYGDPLDEPFHYAYAAYVAETGRIPGSSTLSLSPEVLRPRDWLPRSALPGPRISWREFAALTEPEKAEHRRQGFRYIPEQRREFATTNYEVQQPPLAYAVAAGLLSICERAPLDLRLLLLRLAWSAIAASAAIFTFAFFRRFFPERTALAATLAWASFPGLGSLVGRFTNDSLALPITAALLVLWVDIARGGLSRRKAMCLAFLTALGCWVKLYMLLLLPVAPLAALFAPRARRRVLLQRSLFACVAAFLALVPWLVHQHADTGDWLGLTPSKQATQLGLGFSERVSGSLERLAQGRFWIVFGRTFLWPGTWSAMGAPAALAVLLGAAFLSLLLGTRSLRSGDRPRVRSGAAAAGAAVALFGIGQLLYAGTFAAIARSRGHAPSAGPDGWYLLILLPVFWTLARLLGRTVRAGHFLIAAVIFLLCEWRMTLGLLPGVYSGALLPNGSDAAFADYARLFLWPSSALRVFDSVGLLSGPWLRIALASWAACLLGVVILMITAPGTLDRARATAAPVAG
jgi:4-amino-4-deoxy-L-arabinose transferase-like glycosyltransferase